MYMLVLIPQIVSVFRFQMEPISGLAESGLLTMLIVCGVNGGIVCGVPWLILTGA